MGKGLPRVALCIRKASSWAKQQPYHRVDRPSVFDAEQTKKDLPLVAPGLVEMFDIIANMDETKRDYHKHFVFTDVASSGKFIAGAFSAMGYNLITKPSQDLTQTPYMNVALITSSTFAEKNQETKVRKKLLEIFNDRTENVDGKRIRFIILDSGFKEGIDLYDVKYVHLLEPLLTKADQAQAIGRATRYCGQMGLRFQQGVGWPLYVYRYNAFVSQDHLVAFGGTLFDFFVKASGIDPSKIYLTNEIDTAVITGAVDRLLTKNLHQHMNLDSSTTRLQEEVSKTFKQYSWEVPAVKNRCDRSSKTDSSLSGGSVNPHIVQFNDTQNFIRSYFTPTSTLKGMLLYHSVGTGKTCTAIAAASSFQADGYTILWVTRHTLRAEVWKNIFHQVCNVQVQDMIKNKALSTIPETNKERLNLLNHQWLEPLSYKQFGNMLEKNNKFYQRIVSRNGEVDPLRKTFLVIDEVHKLFTKDIKATERVDPNLLLQWIRNSYLVSGDDSVRVLLMTATPMTDDPMSMIRILNFLRPATDPLPETPADFKDRFLNAQYQFSKSSLQKFHQLIDGQVSYVNRTYDASQYAIPKIIDVDYMMSSTEGPSKLQLQNEIKGLRAKMKDYVATSTEEINDIFDTTMDTLEQEYARVMTACKTLSTPSKRTACEKDAKIRYQEDKTLTREERDNAKQAVKIEKQRLVNIMDQKKTALSKYMKQKLAHDDKVVVAEIKNIMKEIRKDISLLKTQKRTAVNEIAMEKLDLQYLIDQEKAGDRKLVKRLQEQKQGVLQRKKELTATFDSQLTVLMKRLESEKTRLQKFLDKEKPLQDATLTQSGAIEKCMQSKNTKKASRISA